MTQVLVTEAPIEVRPATDSDILEAAADIIEERGWAQGQLVSWQGGVCMRGALFCALGYDPYASDCAAGAEDEVDHLDGILAARVGLHHPLSVASWNDNVFRLKTQVLALLRDTALDLRGGGE